MYKSELFGNASALLAAGLFGAAVVSTRVAAQDVPPLSLAVIRFGQGGLFFLLGLLVMARRLLRVKRRDLPYPALLGNGLVLLTALCGAMYGIMAPRMLRRYSPLAVTTYAMLFGTLPLSQVAAFEGARNLLAALNGSTVWLLLFLGVVCGAFGFLLWTPALAGLSPSQVAVYANMTQWWL